MPENPTSLSIVCLLPPDGDLALGALQALAGLDDAPDHDVVLVDDATYALDGVLACVEGVTVVRRAERGGFLTSLTDAVPRAQGDQVIVTWGGAGLNVAAVRALVAAMSRDGVAAATACTGALAAPVQTQAFIVGASVLADALLSTPSVAEEQALASLLLSLTAHGSVTSVTAAVVTPAVTRVSQLRHAPGVEPELSIVVPTLDVTSPRVIASLRALQTHTDVAHEVIVVDNGAPPQGFSAPVNSGIRAARGRYVVVMNDDVEVLPGWWGPLRSALDAGASVVFPMTVDTAMRHDFAAWCFALSQETVAEFSAAPGEFLEPTFRVWFQDTDLLHRLRQAGRPPQLVAESCIRHGLSVTVQSPDPALRTWIDQQILRDKAAFCARWGTGVAGAAR